MKRALAIALVALAVPVPAQPHDYQGQSPMLLTTALLAPPLAYANEPHHDKKASSGTTHAAPALAEGEVRKVDKDAKKITIKHGPIANLDMPAHTMVFQVKDPTMLERVKAGDKVKFEAQKIGGAFLLVSIEKVK